jgi:hypothetical protein
MQRSKQRALSIAATENEQQHQRQMATMSGLHDVFSAHWSHTKPSHNSNIIQPQVIDEPRTPTKTRMGNLWHGLPSPETPNFNENRLDQEPEEGVSPTAVRRSGRLRTQAKPTFKVQHMIFS